MKTGKDGEIGMLSHHGIRQLPVVCTLQYAVCTCMGLVAGARQLTSCWVGLAGLGSRREWVRK